MKVVKRIIIVLTVVVVVPLAAALFVKKDYHIERQITINKPKQVVFDYVKLLKNQDNFSKWAKMDPAMKKSYRGTDGTVGFVSAWDSENKDVGQGEQEIKNIADGWKIDYQLRFIKPWTATIREHLTTEAAGDNQTIVKWGVDGRYPYPTNLMMAAMHMDESFGNDLQTGLDNLKGILEKQ